jgi:hypothetical protein
MQPGDTTRALLSFFASIAVLVVLWQVPSNAKGRGQSSNSATQAQAEALPASASELVRQTIDNELKQTIGDEKYFYRVHKTSPSGEQVKEYVETDDGAVGRMISVNGQPLSDEQRRKEDQHLQKLATDPDAQKKRRKEQAEDQERINKIIKSMPDAFLFQYDGEEDSPSGKLVRLTFKPNPNFNPPNRESQVYRGMAGTMLIAPAEKRMAKISGTLFQDVNFGWGIFGRLDKGGKFEVEQSKVSPRRWETTSLNMKFTGRVLLFKKLNIDEREITSDFRPAPAHLTLAEGINVLNQQTGQLAQEGTTASKADSK